MKRFAVRTAATAAGLSVALLGSACESAPPPPPTPIINLDTLPHQLPETVSRQAAATVAVQALLGKRRGGPAYSSGVRIAPDLYVAAGHAVDSGHNQPLDVLRACGRLVIDGRGRIPAHLGIVNPLTYKEAAGGGSRITATGQTGSFVEGDHTAVPDIALLQAPPTRAVSRFTPVTFNDQPIRVGEKVYLINYQPGINAPLEDLALRDPYGPSHSIKEMDGRDDEPAEYGGIVGKLLKYGRFIVFTGTRNYGPHPDRNAHEGSSGGGLWLGNGDLAAVVADGPVIDDADAVYGIDGFSTTGVDKLFHVRIQAHNAPSGVSYVIAQTVTPSLVQHEERQLAAAPTCQS